MGVRKGTVSLIGKALKEPGYNQKLCYAQSQKKEERGEWFSVNKGGVYSFIFLLGLGERDFPEEHFSRSG